MKPIRLWMEGIGSYRNETCIDFSTFYPMGIYLITGDTGAGKTTLFDGMMYALYGKASGSLRTGNDLKSDYVQETVRSNVKLEFSHQGELYTVTRLSAYKRPKKRKVGEDTYMEVSAEAEFVSKEGEVISGWDKVTQKIVELIGLTDEQFRQTVMLSQGEFAKVLSADTAERKKIFRSLFHTQLYDVYSYQVKRDVIRSKEDYEKEKIKWMQYMSQIVVSEEQTQRYEKLASCVAQCKTNHAQGVTDGAKYWLQQMEVINEEYQILEKENKKKLKSFEEEWKEKTKEKESYQVLETEVKNQEKQKLMIRNALEAKSQLEEQLMQKKEQEAEFLKKEEEIRAFENECILLRNTLPEYEKKEQEKKNYETNKENVTQLEQQEKQYVKMEVEMKEKLQRLQLEREELGNEGMTVLQIQVQLERMQRDQTLNEEVKELLIKYQKKQLEKQEIEERYQICTEEYQEEKNCYDREELKFYHGQAGILAEKLENGMPCPVCGSCEHPKPAVSAQALSRQELDAKKEILEKKHAAWIQLSKEASVRKNTLEKDWEYICQQIEKLPLKSKEEEKRTGQEEHTMDENVLFVTTFLQNIQQQSQQIAEVIHQMESDLQRAKQCEERKKQLEEERIPTCEQMLTDCRDKLIQIRQDLSGKRAALVMQKEVLEGYHKRLAFQTLNEVKDRIGNLEKAVTQFFAKKQQLQNEVEHLTGEIKKNIGVIESTNETKSENDYPKLADINERIKSLIQELEQIEGIRLKTYEICASNQKLWTHIRGAYDHVKNAEKEYVTIEGINRIVNGSLGFENFVQIAFFEQIVKEANVYLGQMSSNQYQFLRTNEGKRQNSQSGLNLLILDRYTGRKRNVTTLSGGELFKASLAMALGLSTMIQGFYGGKKIESMFVDEGFGNLDERSLEEAVSTLRYLSEKGCLVGVISHVEKLNEWIPARIVVTRNGYCGSSVELQN